ncbi:MAG: hypothetical protein AABX70_05255 [Nanoarchaeota archaeon]
MTEVKDGKRENKKSHKHIEEALNKTIRLIRSTDGMTPGRKGRCTPTKCSTRDGKRSSML